MNDRLRQWWSALQERERWILAGGALVVALIIAYLVLDPLFNGVSARATRVAEKEALLTWMQRGAARLPQGGTMAPTVAPVIVVNKTAQSARLSAYLKQADPVGESGVRATFEAVPFDALVGWLAQVLSENGLRIESAQLDPSGRPGTTDARLSLERGGT